MSASKTVGCVYEGGVLKPLDEVDFNEGERLKPKVVRFDALKFCGVFGEGSWDEFGRFDEETQIS
ncbi:MAG: antitoxin family protein [Methanotrichaceae archaeon]|nr:antitoxin family protein [Methanotrichaceae archaeon]